MELVRRFLEIRFTDPQLEARFSRYFCEKTREQNRIALVLGLALYSSFALLDTYMMGDNAYIG